MANTPVQANSPSSSYLGVIVEAVDVPPTPSDNQTLEYSLGPEVPVRTRDEDLARVEIAVLITILVVAFVGNGIVMLAVQSLARQKKLSRMNRMIGHLTLADLFVGFFNVLPQLAWKVTFKFVGGAFFCKAVTYGQLVAMYAASYVLVSTAVDRYIAICHPMMIHSWTSRRMHLLVSLAWIVALVFSIPQLFVFTFRKQDNFNEFDCLSDFQPEWTIQLYITWVTLTIYAIPTVILVVVYSKICLAVWRSAGFKASSTSTSSTPAPAGVPNNSLLAPARGSNTYRFKPTRYATSNSSSAINHNDVTVPIRFRESPQRSRDSVPVHGNGGKNDGRRAHATGMSRAKIKTVKLTMVVIGSYIVCYGPFFVFQMWAAWDENAPFEDKSMAIILLLASLNSCTNPWICLAFNGQLLRNCSLCPGRFDPRPKRRAHASCYSSTMTDHQSQSNTHHTFMTSSGVDNSKVESHMLTKF